MKFTQEELKKVFFMTLLLVGSFYVYHQVILAGISAGEKKKTAEIKKLEPKIKAAKDQIQRTKVLEGQAATVGETLDQIKALIPAGAPIAWFPPRITEFLKRQGINKSVTRQNEELPDKDLEGFSKRAWTIDLPKVEFAKLGIAVAGLENEDPLLEIHKIQITENKDEPLSQSVTMNVVTIVKQ